MWPVKFVQNYWSPEGDAPQQEKRRCVNTKDVFTEKWTTQNNTSPADERERRKPVLISLLSGQRAFITSRQLPLWRSLISLEGVPSRQDRTEVCPLPRSSQNFKPSQERHGQQQQMSLLTEAHGALKLSTTSHNKSMRNPACFTANHFWLLITIMSIFRSLGGKNVI